MNQLERAVQIRTCDYIEWRDVQSSEREREMIDDAIEIPASRVDFAWNGEDEDLREDTLRAESGAVVCSIDVDTDDFRRCNADIRM